ncbi:MAG: murein L,D-transpeptidase catalytic domain family protein [Ferruginibacter sp.]|nr:murein L,D-transpeptidase catalytic domain family protein [Ferruginibacter sp.]
MKNAVLKKVTIIFVIVFSCILNLPLVFATTIFDNTKSIDEPVTSVSVSGNNANTNLEIFSSALYDSMQLSVKGLSQNAFNYAIKGFYKLLNEGRLKNDDIITIVDFSLPSTQKRLFVINLNKKEVLFNTYVAHGINSGKLKANKFSNSPESYKSSLGFYQTLETYMGGHGYSLRLQGLEKGINDNAKRRGIVIHGADYVDENFIRMQGYIGRSWGCPALPVKLYKPIINTIKNGTCLFIYSPDKFYLKKSGVINA